MIRTFALFFLALLLAGCLRNPVHDQGPFGVPNKEPPQPSGSVVPTNPPPHPVGGQSPLGIASADPTQPRAPDEPSLVPSKSANLLPPGKRRPDLKSDSFPSPFAPKEPPAAPKEPLTSPIAPKEPQAAPMVPPAPNAATKNLMELKTLVAASNAAWKAVSTYEAVLTRRELNPKGQVNNEVVVFQFRREPMSVYTLNTSESGKGRETIYNPGKFDDKLHVKLGKGDPFPGAGFVAPPISPDDARVKAKARYSIREPGFLRTINALSATVAKLEAGKLPAEAVTFDGEVKRDEFAFSPVGVTHKLRPGDDPVMPLGGMRLYFLDMRKDSPAYGMPVLVTAIDSTGREVEYYLYEQVKQPANLTDATFDPARLSKK